MEKRPFNGFDKKITIPEGVKRILEGSLLGLDFATDIFLPSTLEEFTPYAIMEEWNMENDLWRDYPKTSIKLHIENNEHFTTVNGSIYTSDMKTLLYMPNDVEDEDFPLSDEVQILGEGCCSYVHGVYPHFELTVILKDTVKRVCKNAFYGANIHCLGIPLGTEIESGAFAKSRINKMVIRSKTIRSGAFTDCREIFCTRIRDEVKFVEKHAFKLGTMTNIYISPSTEVDSEFIDFSDTVYLRKYAYIYDPDDPDCNKMTRDEAKGILTIGGAINSSAHRYAIENGIRFIEVENEDDKIDEFLVGYHYISRDSEELPF